MGQITLVILRAAAEQSLQAKHIHFGNLRSGDAVSAVFGHIQMASLGRAGVLDAVQSATAVLADSALLEKRVRELGANLKDPLSTPRMLRRAEECLLQAARTVLAPTPVHRSFDEFRLAVFERARAFVAQRLEEKLNLRGTDVQVDYALGELMPLAQGEPERVISLNMKCIPHRWGVEAALAPMISNGAFMESVDVRLQALGRGAMAAFIEQGETIRGPHALRLSAEDWAAHAPLHLLEAAGLTQAEALTLKARQVFVGGMDVADAGLASYPDVFGKEHLQRIKDVGATLRRLGLSVIRVSSAYHYGESEDSAAKQKLLARYPEGVVLASREDMARDAVMRQAWVEQHKRQLPEARHGYLMDPQEQDPERAARGTQVFLREWVAPDAEWTLEDALVRLRARAKSAPVPLEVQARGERMTVKVTVRLPGVRMELGYSAPQLGMQRQELKEITRLLLAHGVQTQLVQEGASALPA